jgi:hypothetical protein
MGRNNCWIVTKQVVFNCCKVFRTITNFDLLMPSRLSCGTSVARRNISITIAVDLAEPTGPRTARTRESSSMNFRSVGGGV